MSTTFFEDLLPENIARLRPYQPGKPVEELERELGITGAIKIASNENPIGPSPLAVEAAREAMAGAHFYPDGYAYKLRRAVAERRGVAAEELVFGAGSNELVYVVVNALCRPGHDQVVTHKYAFVSYKLASLSLGVDFVEADVTGDLEVDADALIAAMTPNTKVVFLANPNNPTGRHVPTAVFERILDAVPERALLVVDEAYHEYAVAAGADYPSSQTYRTDARPNILTLRTFSKIYGLAGLRVGYGIGHPDVIAALERVRRPFNVNSIAQAAARAALDDHDHVEASAAAARTDIAALTEHLTAQGLRVYPSLTNFVLVDVGRDAAGVYDTLLRKGLIVRPMGPWGLPTCLRISVGIGDGLAKLNF